MTKLQDILQRKLKSSAANVSALMASPDVSAESLDAIADVIAKRCKQVVLASRKGNIPSQKIFFEIADNLQVSPRLNYQTFCATRASVPDCAKKYFSAKEFLRYARDEECSIDTEEFLRCFQRTIDVETAILDLYSYASESVESGYITEHELEQYIFELIPKLSVLSEMHDSFKPFYVYTASRRFLFHLDMRRTRKLNIKNLCNSIPMEELLFMKRVSQYQNHDDTTNHILQEQLNRNWFMPMNTLHIYQQYLQLDSDKNGTITREDLLGYQGDGTGLQLTQLAIDRIFEVNLTYAVDGRREMDYKAFLDLVLAVENRDAPESIKYFWRLLDVDHNGKLNSTNIAHFYNSVASTLKIHRYDAPRESDVIWEIYDMVGLTQDQDITLQHLMRSEQGSIVVAILTDANSFWQYDNRESLLQSVPGEEDEGVGGE